MHETSEQSEQDAMVRLMSEQVPQDTRQARQLARRQQIAELVMAEGTMRIEEIAERFETSLMTAHRDLDDLADRGLLRKTRGLVSSAPTSLVEASDVYRSAHQSAEKAAIAAAAVALVEPGEALFMDDSTTVGHMVPGLAHKTPLTVITNSLTLMNALRGMHDLSLIGLGGQFQAWCNAFVGRMTAQEAARLRADTAFLSMAAITDDMVFHQSAEMVDTKRAMFDAAARRVLLADHTKFERRALHGMVELDAFDTVIVDGFTPEPLVARMKAKGIEVRVAPVAAT